MKTAVEYCKRFEFEGENALPELAAAGRLVCTLVDMAKVVDARGGVGLVNSVLSADLPTAGRMLAIATGIIAANEVEAEHDRSDV